MNIWKISTIVLCCIFTFLLIINLLNPPVYKFDELKFEISKNDFNSVSDLLSYGQSSKVCNTETNDCIIITKIK